MLPCKEAIGNKNMRVDIRNKVASCAITEELYIWKA